MAKEMNKLKVLTLLSTMMFLIWFFLPYVSIPTSENVQRILSWNGYGASVHLNHPLIFGFSFAWRMFAMLGLLLCKKWAIPMFGFWLITNILLSSFGGLVITTGLDMMIGYVATLSDGILLSYAFKIIGGKANKNGRESVC